MSAQISEIDTIPESLVDIKLAEAALAIARDRLQWNSCRDFFGPVVNALARIGAEPYLSGGTIYVAMTGDKDKLTQAFRIFRTVGMEFAGDRPKKGDSSWSAIFKHPSQTVYVYFQFTSSVCRRVKVGTKTVEQDVYETQCGDLSTDEPAPLLTIVPPMAALEADEIPF
jgi:hypothetical protein